MSKITVIDFHGHPLYTFEQNGQVYVLMRPITDALGLAWHGQYERIMRDKVLSDVRVTRTTEYASADGKKYEMLCLPIDFMNGWLFGVSESRIRPELLDSFIQYKRECYRVLFEHWHGKQTMPMIQSMKYWDTKYPHWATIKAYALQGLSNKDIAPLLMPFPDGRPRSPGSVGRALRRQFDVGYTNPVEVFSARLKPETALRWAVEKPVAAQWGKSAENQMTLAF